MMFPVEYMGHLLLHQNQQESLSKNAAPELEDLKSQNL